MIKLKFDTEIKGDSDTKGYEDWITLSSVNFNVERPIAARAEGRGARNTVNPHFSALSCAKRTDTASPELMFQAAGGAVLGNAELEFLHTGGEDNTHRPYLKVKLGNAMVSGYNFNGSDQGEGYDDFQIVFETISFEYLEHSKDGTETGTSKGWNTTLNTQHAE